MSELRSDAAAAAEKPDRSAWFTLGAIAAGYLVVQLAMTPVSISLPSILAEFDGELVLASWVMSAYFLCLTAALLPAGRIGDRIGRERVFLWGVIGFIGASILCAIAPSLLALVIARGLQGLAGALVAATAFGIAVSTFPAHYRGRVVGTVTTASSLGLTLGVLISSLALGVVSWRVLFIATTVLALAVLVPVTRVRRSPRAESGPFDYVGTLLLAGGLVATFLTLSHAHDGPETFEAGAPYHLTMNTLAVVLFVVFVWWERRSKHALLDPRIFTRGAFATSSGANVIMHMTMMSVGFLLPFLVERGMGRPPIEAGFVIMTSQIATTSFSAISGLLYDRTRSPLIRPGALLAIAVGLGCFAWFGTSLGYPAFIGFAALTGFGTGMFMTTNNVVIMSSVPPSMQGLANGMIETTRQLGHGLSVAIAGSIMAAAVFGATGPEAYVTGFRQAMAAMSVVALLGVGLAGYSLFRPEQRGGTTKPGVASQSSVTTSSP